MKVVAALLQDPNPLHFDVDAVQRAGLGRRRINQGPASVSHVYTALLERFPQGRLATAEIRYLGVVREDDLVQVTGTVESVDRFRTGTRAVCRCRLEVVGQGPVLEALVTVLLPCQTVVS